MEILYQCASQVPRNYPLWTLDLNDRRISEPLILMALQKLKITFGYMHLILGDTTICPPSSLVSSHSTRCYLIERGMSGAEVDSSACDHPPKCHLNTRRNLRGRILNE
ncbi:hypothetical protein AN958_04570 [Leucoagaricus sp. SymC.cos]|nr:hypothetical protein AN958_04570 [Leucoagaricus sp. SymC.cos]